MLELENIFGKSHSYTFAVEGINERSKVFMTREAANQHMFKICRKHNLRIEEV